MQAGAAVVVDNGALGALVVLVEVAVVGLVVAAAIGGVNVVVGAALGDWVVIGAEVVVLPLPKRLCRTFGTRVEELNFGANQSDGGVNTPALYASCVQSRAVAPVGPVN